MSKTSTPPNRNRVTILTNVFLLLVSACIPAGVWAQIGPGGVGNATGTGGQPINKLWLRADKAYIDNGTTNATSNNQLVQWWADQSQSGSHASQGTNAKKPTYQNNIINGMPAIRFNGTANELLFGSSLDRSNALPLNFFAVTANTKNPRGLFDSRPLQGDVFRFFNDGSNSNGNKSGTVGNEIIEFWNNNPAVSDVKLDQNGSIISVVGALSGSSQRQLSVFQNSKQEGSTVTGNTDAVQFTSARLGSINNGVDAYYNGDIAEVIYYSSALSTPQCIIVENYLGAKYGISLNSPNDYYSSTTAFNDVIGIGTSDDTTKHSTSTGGALWLTEASSTLNASNEYVFAGHDGTAHSSAATNGLLNVSVVAALITSRWAREYRIEKTGTADVSLGFDYTVAGLTRLSNTPSDYVLLYRSGTGNYSIVPTSAVDLSIADRVTFTVTNTNLANGYYTLGLKAQSLATTLYTYNTNCAGGCDWSTATSWTTDASGSLSLGAIVPRSIDNAVILNGAKVTIAANGKTVATATINTGGRLDLGTTTLHSFTTLAGAGTLRLSALAAGSAVFPTVSTNTFVSTAGSTVEYYGSTSYTLPSTPTTYHHLIFSGGGTKTAAGVITANGNFSILASTSVATGFDLNLKGNFTNSGTSFVASNGRTTFNSGGSQSISGSGGTTFFNLTIGNTANTAVSLSQNITVAGTANGTSLIGDDAALGIGSGGNIVLNAGSKNIIFTGNGGTWVNGSADGNTSFVPGSGTVIFGGNTLLNNTTGFNHLQINSGAGVTSSLSSNLFISGNFANNGGTFNQTNGTTTLKGGTQTISGIGTPTTLFHSLMINSGSTTSLTTHNVSIGSDLTVSGTLNLNTYTANRSATGGNLTVNDQGLLRIGGTNTFPANFSSNTFNAVSTVEYYGSSQNVRGLNYSNLTIVGSGTKTVTGASAVVNNNLLVSSSTLELADQNMTVSGTTTVSGTINDKTDAGTNTFSGKMTVNAGGNVTISNASPFVFQGGLTNNGTFNKTGSGTVTFNTNTPQLIDGSSPIKLLGIITVMNNITVNNQNTALTINGMSMSHNAKWNNTYGLPTAYTTFSGALAPIGKFDNLATSNDGGASVASTSGNNLKLGLAGVGTAYAVRTTNFAASSAVVVRFDLSATSAGATNTAASILLGSSFTNDATVNTATARLQVNLGSGSSDYTLTHPDGTPTSSSLSNANQTVTWVINTSGSTVNYTNPDLTGVRSLAPGKADAWLGNTLFAAGLAVQTPAQAMTQLKVVMNNGSGAILLNNIRINPLGTIQVGTLATSAYCITSLTGIALSVPFTTDASMTASTHFNTGNTFTAQLSDANGSFTYPVNIGSLGTTALSGTISATIPAYTPSGLGYQIRVVSNAPISTANASSNFSINLFSLSPYAAQSIVPDGVGTTLTASGSGVTSYQWGYYTILGGPITNLVGKTSATYTPTGTDFPGAGTYSLVCQMTTSTCGIMTSNEVVLYINCPPSANSNQVVNGTFDDANYLGGTAGFTTQYNYVSGPNSMVPEGTFTIGNNPRDHHYGFCNMTTEVMRSPGSGGNMLIANAATTGSQTVWQQNIPVTINTDYVLTFYASSLAGSATSLQFGIYVGCFRAGADISLPLAVVNCAWNKYSVQLNSGSSISLDLQIRNISAVASGNDIAIDDIEFYPCQQVSVPPFPVANSFSWKGFSSNWFDKDNWGTACAIPTCSDDIFVPLLPSGKVYPMISASGATAKSVTINTGASLTIKPGYNLTLCGDMLNSGTLINSSTSTLTFTGSRNPQQLAGNFTGTNKLGHLVVNKTSATDVLQVGNSMEMAGNLTITSGTLDANGQSMTIGGNMTNAGTFAPAGGTVEFNGTANQVITQSGSAQFYNLVVNNSTATNTLTFNSAVDTLITITNQLTLTRGIVTLSPTRRVFISNTAPTAISGHSASSYVNGRIKRAISGTQIYDFPVGEATRYELLRMQITSPLGPGLTSITGLFNTSNPSVGTGLTGLDGGSSDYTLCNGGYWDLIPNVAAATGARYRLAVFPVGFSCTGLNQTFVKRPHNASAWTFNGSTSVDADTRDGFSSFSEIVPVSSNVALPVRLLNFEGKIKGRQVQLGWRTASEVNNAYFEVQRSSDAKSFEAISRMPGNGTTNEIMTYQSFDDKPLVGFNYYRLKQVDINGQAVYSHIIVVNNEQEVVELFPNPITKGSKLFLRISTLKSKPYSVLIYDLQGREISKETIKVDKGTTDVHINRNALLSSGNYIVRVLHAEQTELQNVWLFRLVMTDIE